MEIKQIASHLALAVDAVKSIDGVCSVISIDEDIEVCVRKDFFDSIEGDAVVDHEPDDRRLGKLCKMVNGVIFYSLVHAKEFYELYPILKLHQTEERVIENV